MNVQELIDFLLVKFPDNTTGAITPKELREGLAEFANRSELKNAIGTDETNLSLTENTALLKANANNEIYAQLIANVVLGDEAIELFSEDTINGIYSLIRARANGNIELSASSTINIESNDIIQLTSQNGLSANFSTGTFQGSNSVSLGTNDFYIEANNLAQRLTLFSNDLIRKEALNKIENLVFGGENKIVQDGVAGSILLEVTTSQFISIIKDSLIEMISPVVQIQATNSVSMQTGFGQVECDSQGVRISRTGGQYIRFGNVPIFADHATADASVLSESIYKLTGDRTLYQKP
jgi:hypothetical protein